MASCTQNRSKLACVPCTRRKVRCSKTVPCTNCVRRGEQDSCALDGDSPSPDLMAGRRPSTSTTSHAAPTAELEYLRRKVAELEQIVRKDASSDVCLPLPQPVEQTSLAVQQIPIDPSLQHRAAGGDDDDANSSSSSSSIKGNDDSVGGAADDADHVMKDAASILEFLAWGRRKDADYRSVVSPDDIGDVPPRDTEPASDTFDECSQPAVLQLLLPSPRQVWQLVNYHDECLLWYHGSYFAPTFRAQLEDFYAHFNGIITSPGVDLQWVALLFSVISSTLACAPPARAQSWGFRAAERETLSKRWFQAVHTCLNRAGYMANLSIFSCQAIATSTIAAHLLGFSNSQSIYLAAAVRIAQSLTLHRLGPEASGTPAEKEIGRRVWCQLCSQDWFSIPFSESYLVNPVYSTSDPPENCHDDDLIPLPYNEPTRISYCRFLREIAAIMPQLQDGLMACNTTYTRYEQVLAWDARLRTLVTAERPSFLSSTIPIEPDWPLWIPWARRALAISTSHKVIMIHRSFLSESFTNPAFSFTRRTCLAASKTIIKEYKNVIVEDGPILWIYQAFSVAAAIILILDILHRDPAEREWSEHRKLAEDVVWILRSCQNSMIASRGVSILSALLEEVHTAANARESVIQPRKRARDGSMIPAGGIAGKVNKFDVPCFVRAFCKSKSVARETAKELPPWTSTPEDDPPPLGYESGNHQHQQQKAMTMTQAEFNLSFPPAGLDGANGFENLLYLANHDCYSIF